MPITPPIDLARTALKDKSLSAGALAFKIVVQCRRTVQLETADLVTSGLVTYTANTDTPGLEGYLWSIWAALSSAATEDPSRYDFFADVLTAIRAKGNEDDNWVIWGRTFNWAKLPLWGPTIAETMHCGAHPSVLAMCSC